MKVSSYAQCLVACELAREHFDLGQHDEGMVAYCLALEAQAKVTHPLHFLESVVACELILREYLWTQGDDDV